MAGEKVPENAGLSRLDGESKLNHRALVLYAMQDEHRRSMRAAAGGVQRSEGSLRVWAARWEWHRRIEREGLTVQARACQLYRELYHGDYRLRDVEGPVAQRMSVPVLAASPPPRAGQPDEATSNAIADARANLERQKPSQEISERDKALRTLEDFRRIAEEVIKRFAKRLARDAKNPLNDVSVREVIEFMREHRTISEALGDLAPPTAQPTALETSFRVREAERTGKPVTAALLEDLREQLAILETIAVAEERDPKWLEVAQAAQGRESASDEEDEEAAEG